MTYALCSMMAPVQECVMICGELKFEMIALASKPLTI